MLLQRLSYNWESRHDLQKQENKKTMHTIGKIKKKDFSKRMEDTNFSIQKQLDTETLEKFTSAENLDWETASPLTRYESEAPPIILDNIIEDDKINVNIAAMRSDMRILTCHLDKATGKWIEAKRASHPFVKLNMTKVNPYRNNRSEGDTKQICIMADSGSMCTLLTYDTCKAMGVEPESLDLASVSITGVGGIELKSRTRQRIA